MKRRLDPEHFARIQAGLVFQSIYFPMYGDIGVFHNDMTQNQESFLFLFRSRDHIVPLTSGRSRVVEMWT